MEDKKEHKWIPLSRWFRAVYLYGETLAMNRVFTKRDSTRSGKSVCNHYVSVSMGISLLLWHGFYEEKQPAEETVRF